MSLKGSIETLIPSVSCALSHSQFIIIRNLFVWESSNQHTCDSDAVWWRRRRSGVIKCLVPQMCGFNVYNLSSVMTALHLELELKLSSSPYLSLYPSSPSCSDVRCDPDHRESSLYYRVSGLSCCGLWRDLSCVSLEVSSLMVSDRRRRRRRRGCMPRRCIEMDGDPKWEGSSDTVRVEDWRLLLVVVRHQYSSAV